MPVVPQWDDLDFLGWIHRSGHLGFIVFRAPDETVGVALERTIIRTEGARSFMCDLCCTLHQQGGVARFARWNRARTQSRSQILCADLKCSLYVRGQFNAQCIQMAETVGQTEKIERVRTNLSRLVRNLNFDDV